MIERKKFKSAEHFRVVLLGQLKTIGQNEVNKIQRIQKQVAFDRFLQLQNFWQKTLSEVR